MRVKIVINPAAGQPEPVLSILNDAFAETDVRWDVDVVHQSGDGYESARRGLSNGYDVICAYGGDGTVGEVAQALAQTETPMGILPGGTGNALAADLGLPLDLAGAAAVVASADHEIRRIDVGRAGDRMFVLRATMGLEVSVVEAATRELKDRFGWLAYAFGSLQALTDPPTARYTLDIDGRSIERTGLACIVANSASMGVMGLRLSDQTDVSDGLLDVIIAAQGDLPALAGSAVDLAQGSEPRIVTRWQGRNIRVVAEPAQAVLADGEEAGTTPVEISLLPGALKVIVPGRADAD